MSRFAKTFVFLLLAACASACGDKSKEATEPAKPSQATAPAQTPPAESAATTAAGEPAPTPESEDRERALSVAVQPWKGDFDQMVERKVIRVLVPYSRTLYFMDKGHEDGITLDTVRDFETYINKKYRKDKRPITVIVVATTRDKLLPNVAAGLGDIAAGAITYTDKRAQLVDFYAPDTQKPHSEIVVTGPNAPALKTLDDLAGKTVAVRAQSAYLESLAALNQRFAAEKKAAIKIQSLPGELEDEDILEMTNAGLLDIVVVDDWQANVWKQVLPKLTVHDDMAVRTGARFGWAVRKDSPQLKAAIEDFRTNHLVKLGVGPYRLAQYMKRFKQMANPGETAEYKRFQSTVELFRKYGAQYDFDPMMLAAQGYQESRLDQGAKSHVGAIGVMQLMPATGKELAVGDISQVEPNIHAGAKYMDQLMTRYFQDAKFDEQNRSLIAFAAYNAGPGRIQQMRKLATSRGLDPDKWFNNVEIVTAEKVGMETTTYVRNIYKYYVSYKLMFDAAAAREKAQQKVSAG